MVVAKTLYLCIVVAICAITDIRHRKIKNCWVLALVAGWLFYFLYEGRWKSFADAVLGMLTLALIFLPLYLVRAAGAGDVKLAGAVGLYIGMAGAESFLTAMCASGGCLALGKMLYYGNFRRRMSYFCNYVRQVMLTRQITTYGMVRNEEEIIGMAVPILCGVLWCYR